MRDLDGMTALAVFLTAAAGYLLGSINCGIILSRGVAKEDIRSYGSGNAGSTNMYRAYGWRLALATVLGDALKGALAVMAGRLICRQLAPGFPYGVYVGMFAALIGHMFPVFFGFRGGKGIATALGAILALSPVVFGIIAIVFIPIVPITGYVSLASVLGAAGFPVVLGLVRWFQGQLDPVEMALAVIAAALILYMHRANIRRLLNGTESNVKKKNR